MEKNKHLETIRNYRGSLEDFEAYWASRGVAMSPYDKVEYEYPKKKNNQGFLGQ